MSKANQKSKYFTKRGERTAQIEHEGEVLPITVCVPTNFQHDSMMEEFTDVGPEGEMITHGAELIEARLIRFVIDLPFDVPIDDSMVIMVAWRNASDGDKQSAVRMIDSALRDKINNAIVGNTELTEDEAGN